VGEWIRNISLFAIFSSLVLMLAPDSNYRHEIEIVTGLIMLILVINPVTVFLNGDYDNELRAIIANENSNIRDILQQDNTYVNQKDDMILALAIKKYIYSEMSMDCDVTVSGSYGVSGAASNKRGETGSKAEEISDSKTVGASGSMQVYITIKGRYATSQGMEDNNEIIENQVVKLVCNGFGIDEESISVKLEIK
jgi:stage III sporulation protein AF